MDDKLSDHAQHYIGWSNDVFARLREHKHNQGARILEVCNERGIGYHIARVWRGRNRHFERQLKNRKNARILCPECNPFSARSYPTKRRSPRKADDGLLYDGTPCPF
jgi:predicted GIY-YIG superfamily endonuclease